MDATTTPTGHPVVTRRQWLQDRKALLAHEKDLTRARDRLAGERRALPWVRVEAGYVFEGPDGRRTLADLFEGRRQLLVQHFMLAPGWEQGCPSCSYMADHLGGMLPHLAARDVSVAVVSRAPIGEIERFRRRMGWTFPWVSSHGSSFNHDFGVSFTPEELARGEVVYNFEPTPWGGRGEEAPGISLFLRDDAGTVFHTYSTYGRGVEAMMGTYDLLDLTPLGRHESNPVYAMDWVRHHDRYEAPAAKPAAASCCSAKA